MRPAKLSRTPLAVSRRRSERGGGGHLGLEAPRTCGGKEWARGEGRAKGTPRAGPSVPDGRGAAPLRSAGGVLAAATGPWRGERWRPAGPVLGDGTRSRTYGAPEFPTSSPERGPAGGTPRGLSLGTHPAAGARGAATVAMGSFQLEDFAAGWIGGEPGPGWEGAPHPHPGGECACGRRPGQGEGERAGRAPTRCWGLGAPHRCASAWCAACAPPAARAPLCRWPRCARGASPVAGADPRQPRSYSLSCGFASK